MSLVERSLELRDIARQHRGIEQQLVSRRADGVLSQRPADDVNGIRELVPRTL
jgi:hypothetical protein